MSDSGRSGSFKFHICVLLPCLQTARYREAHGVRSGWLLSPAPCPGASSQETRGQALAGAWLQGMSPLSRPCRVRLEAGSVCSSLWPLAFRSQPTSSLCTVEHRSQTPGLRVREDSRRPLLVCWLCQWAPARSRLLALGGLAAVRRADGRAWARGSL